MATLPVRAPFRLDLTANALRRLSINVVDTYSVADGYLRAHRGAVVLVRQAKRDSPLDVRALGTADFDPVALVARMLGTDCDLRPYYRAVKAIPWLDALATRMRGIKPPRYPTLWEAIVNAVVFQQLSIHAASAILRRIVERLGTRVEHQGRTLYGFFDPAAFLGADPEALRALGLSTNKSAALRAHAEVLIEGGLPEGELERLSTDQVLGRLMTLRGVGPWTAAVIALRGLGRLDVFPLEDTGVAASLKAISGDESVDVGKILTILGPQRGMLYYHLLLGRLESRGALEASDAVQPARPAPAPLPRPPVNRQPPRKPDRARRRGGRRGR